ncbi:hypothetical protein DMENIID0001_019750 [Sergentomyia squamirostris]
MGELNDAVIKKTQEVLGKYVKKPPLTEKLLTKPPFRFLHDVINVVIKETGFLKGLYTTDELNSENIRDREAKIKFLEKLINIVEMVTKTELKVRPSKIVAGQEPEKTNELLQAIGMAIEKKLDSKAAIEAAKASIVSKQKGGKAPTVAQKTKPSPTTTTPASKTQKTTNKSEKTDKKPTPNEKKSKESSKTSKTDTKTREKPKTETKPSRTTSKKSENDNLIVKNEKNKKDQDKKRIDSGIKLEDSPNEHDGTSNREDSPKGIELTLEATPKVEEKVEEVPKNQDSIKEPDHTVEEIPKPQDELVDIIDEEAERRRKERRSSKSRSQEEPSQTIEEPPATFEELPKEAEPEPAALEETPESRPVSHQRKRTKSSDKVRQKKSATRDSAKEVKDEKEITKKPFVKQSSVDGNGKIQNVPRPRTSLRPPSVRPASARPGAPRRRDRNVEIVLQPDETMKMGDISVKMENFSVDLEDDGENLIIIEDSTSRDDPLQMSPSVIDTVDAQDHGHLVQQILETQKGLTGGKSSTEDAAKSEDWNDRRSRQASTQQMDALRESIQKLTRAVNPLGKLMNFLQEDIDSMQREFNMWREMHQIAVAELNREKAHSQPATDALKQLNASIAEHLELIDISRGNILQNEQKIAKLLTNT